jgi:N-acetylmuramoyl-L-alanine amidase
MLSNKRRQLKINHIKNKSLACLAWFCLLLIPSQLFAAASAIEGIRFWQSPEKTRVVFDMSAAPKHKLFRLSSPERVVVDIDQGSLAVDLNKLNIDSTLIQRIRSSKSSNGKLRIVLDLKRSADPKSFTLRPVQNIGNRLVIDLIDPLTAKPAEPAITRAQDVKKDELYIVIDAGHGGEDPGAIGYHGTREKQVTLGIARKLADKINRQQGMRAELSRKGDYYLTHRKRSDLARTKGADLFISIHADSFTSSKVRGASVWVLDDKGANSEVGRWLEQRESAADLLGGVESVALNSYDEEVAEVLLKIQTERSVGLSHSIANNILQELEQVTVLHNRKPRDANFLVLKNPAVPSLLIETGFISNAKDEKQLKNANFQHQVAERILSGIHRYFSDNTPNGVKLAQLKLDSMDTLKTHKVRRGDTLSGIAYRYGVSLKHLKAKNNLKSDKLFVGKRLVIPQ